MTTSGAELRRTEAGEGGGVDVFFKPSAHVKLYHSYFVLEMLCRKCFGPFFFFSKETNCQDEVVVQLRTRCSLKHSYWLEELPVLFFAILSFVS